MLPPAAVVFDLDGTLVDSRGDIVAAMNHALIQTGRAPLPAQVIVHNVGDGARTLCARSAKLPEISEEVDSILELFLAYYNEHPVDFTRWIPGAKQEIDQITEMHLPLGVCTK